MVEKLPPGGKPAGGNSFLIELWKSTTFRVILPIVLSAHLGWFYLHSQVVYDYKEKRYVFRSTLKDSE